MGRKEDNRRWYLKHRDEQIARTRAYQAEHPEAYRKQALAYYYAHREERLAYYQTNKKKIQERTRQNTIHYGQRGSRPDILGVNKTPYPSDNRCTYCGRIVHYSLRWHHWNDSNPSDGVWLCQRCHAHIDALLRRAKTNKAKLITDLKLHIFTSPHIRKGEPRA